MGYVIDGKEDKVLKSKKALYGLTQAPRVRYCRNDKHFKENGFTRPLHEYAIYVKVVDKNILNVCIYMNDLIFTGNNPQMFEDFKSLMAQEFEMSDMGLKSYYTWALK